MTGLSRHSVKLGILEQNVYNKILVLHVRVQENMQVEGAEGYSRIFSAQIYCISYWRNKRVKTDHYYSDHPSCQCNYYGGAVWSLCIKERSGHLLHNISYLAIS